MIDRATPGDPLLERAVAALVAGHVTDRDYDSAEVVRDGIEVLALANGHDMALHAVNLDVSPPVAEVRIPRECLDEDTYCRELQRLVGPSVRLVPYISPLAYTRGKPPATP